MNRAENRKIVENVGLENFKYIQSALLISKILKRIEGVGLDITGFEDIWIVWIDAIIDNAKTIEEVEKIVTRYTTMNTSDLLDLFILLGDELYKDL